jgi:hypothetical protein
MSKTKNSNTKSVIGKITTSTKKTPVSNNSKVATTSTKKTPVSNNSKVATTSTKKTLPALDKVVAAILTGNTNSKTKKTTVSTDSVSIKNLTDAYNYGTKQQPTKKMPPTHSAYNQLGKKRGPYVQNIWVIEASKDGKRWSPSDDSYTFYKSRDDAREDVASLRTDADSRFRVAKYTFTAVSHS